MWAAPAPEQLGVTRVGDKDVGTNLSQHHHQKKGLSDSSFNRQLKSMEVQFTATLEGVFTENRLSISSLLHGSAGWGLPVCCS